MAFTDLGSLGATGNSGNNQATLTLSIGSAIAAGSLVVIVVGDDNRTQIAGGGDDLAVSGVTIDGVAAAKADQFTTDNLAAQAGASCSVWWWQAIRAVANGSNIIATFTDNTLSDATAISARHFSLAGNVKVAIEATAHLANNAADPGALDAATANQECLRVRGIAGEASAALGGLTVTGGGWVDWADGDSAASGTTGEIAVRAEHHISTGTGDSSNPTWGTCDNASVYVAFEEIPLPFRQTDWPAARRPNKPQFADVAQRMLALAVGPVDSNTYILRGPLYHRIPRIDSPQARDLFNPGLQSAGVVQAPFTEPDWPLPTSRRLALLSDVPANLLPFTTLPFRTDAGVTARRVPSLQSEPAVNELPLLQPNPAQPFVQTDWLAIAKRARALQVDATANLLPFTTLPFRTDASLAPDKPKSLRVDAVVNLLPFTTLPFRPDASVTPDKRKSLPVDAVTNLLPVQTPVVVAAPFAQTDWSAVARRASRAQVDATANLLPFTTLPFARLDWPNAARPKPLAVDATVRLQPLLAPNPDRPFVLLEWGVAAARKPVTVEPAVNFLPLRSVVPAPFLPLDWPNSVRPKPAKQPEVPTDMSALLTPNPAQPFAASDTPLAARRRLTQEPLYNSAVPAAPFRQTDWPALSRLRQIVKSEIAVNFLPLRAVVAAPFAQTDCLNPARKTPTPDEDAFTNLWPLSDETAPFVQFDWPSASLPARVAQSEIAVNFLPLRGESSPEPEPVVVPQQFGGGWVEDTVRRKRKKKRTGPTVRETLEEVFRRFTEPVVPLNPADVQAIVEADPAVAVAALRVAADERAVLASLERFAVEQKIRRLEAAIADVKRKLNEEEEDDEEAIMTIMRAW